MLTISKCARLIEKRRKKNQREKKNEDERNKPKGIQKKVKKKRLIAHLTQTDIYYEFHSKSYNSQWTQNKCSQLVRYSSHLYW